MIEFYAAMISLLIAVALPLSILFVRNTVKKGRVGIIRELEQVYQLGTHSSGTDRIVPSIEFVKYKYDVDDPKGYLEDLALKNYLPAAIPFVFLLFIFGWVAVLFVLAAVAEPRVTSLRIVPDLGQLAKPGASPGPGWVFTITYFGALMFCIRRLLRSVSNFDLSPTTFLNCSVHVLFGIVTAIIIANAWAEVMPDVAPGVTAGALIVVAFVVGFVPDAGLRFLLSRSRLRIQKGEDEEVYKSVRATSIDVLDGIDFEIRQRLGEHNIIDVQNLATANPIMMFVETPYGLYELIDWVGQAQLCCAVGVSKYIRLKKLNIRTTFDLERVVLDDTTSTPELRQYVGAILFDGQAAPGANAGPGSVAYPDSAVVAAVRAIVDDLHVQRLRQIWNRIQERLGPENVRLVPWSKPSQDTRSDTQSMPPVQPGNGSGTSVPPVAPVPPQAPEPTPPH
jgi:hypothetical protein